MNWPELAWYAFLYVTFMPLIGIFGGGLLALPYLVWKSLQKSNPRR